MDSIHKLEYREMNYPVSQNHPAFAYMISCIKGAKDGQHWCYKAHPDYIKRVHNISIGDFPNNIDKIIWCHVGFEGSILPNPVPTSPNVEIHGLLKLNTDLYLRFIFTYRTAESCCLTATASPRRDQLVKDMAPHVFERYIEETRVRPDTSRLFCPSTLSPIRTTKKEVAYTPIGHTPCTKVTAEEHQPVAPPQVVMNQTIWNPEDENTGVNVTSEIPPVLESCPDWDVGSVKSSISKEV